MPVWRFLATGPHSGAYNMAVDEALMEGIIAGGQEPIFRVFGWDPPALSLGYSQQAGREVDLEKCRRAGVDIVRRLTGGRAVLHWGELTYSVICPEDDPELGGRIADTYHRIGQCLVNGLRLFGVEAGLERSSIKKVGPREGAPTAPCFSSTARWEVTCRGRKLIGSAQRRVRGAILQHGSLLIGAQHKKLLDLLPPMVASMREAMARQLEEGSIHLKACTSRRIDFNELADCLAQGFSRCLQVEMQSAALGLQEQQRVRELILAKYGDPAWNGAAMAVRVGVDAVAVES